MLPLQKDEVQPFVVTGQDQQIVSGKQAKGACYRTGVRDRYRAQLEKINLEQPILIGEQLDLLDGSENRVRSDTEVRRRLNPADACVVSEALEERSYAVRIA